MMASLSSVTANRGVAVKAPRATVSKARVATRVQAVRPDNRNHRACRKSPNRPNS